MHAYVCVYIYVRECMYEEESGQTTTHKSGNVTTEKIYENEQIF